MSSHDYVIDNGAGGVVRADLNNALAAIVSNNSGASAPGTTYAYMWWADTTTGALKQRNAANSAWITILPVMASTYGGLLAQFGAAKASFVAHKNGTNQTGIADSTHTKVTFGTEEYDVGGFFASSAWTPPAGAVMLTAEIFYTGTITLGSNTLIEIYKNGSLLKLAEWVSSTNRGGAFINLQDQCNGTDFYEVYCYVDVSSGTATIGGGSHETWFMGTMI